jgi:hypothetical protein
VAVGSSVLAVVVVPGIFSPLPLQFTMPVVRISKRVRITEDGDNTNPFWFIICYLISNGTKVIKTSGLDFGRILPYLTVSP